MRHWRSPLIPFPDSSAVNCLSTHSLVHISPKDPPRPIHVIARCPSRGHRSKYTLLSSEALHLEVFGAVTVQLSQRDRRFKHSTSFSVDIRAFRCHAYWLTKRSIRMPTNARLIATLCNDASSFRTYQDSVILNAIVRPCALLAASTLYRCSRRLRCLVARVPTHEVLYIGFLCAYCRIPCAHAARGSSAAREHHQQV